MCRLLSLSIFFFFNDTATTEIYTLSLHDALPISHRRRHRGAGRLPRDPEMSGAPSTGLKSWLTTTDHKRIGLRSEEHTSELQSQSNLVCRLLLEKKKKKMSSQKIK